MFKLCKTILLHYTVKHFFLRVFWSSLEKCGTPHIKKLHKSVQYQLECTKESKIRSRFAEDNFRKTIYVKNTRLTP